MLKLKHSIVAVLSAAIVGGLSAQTPAVEVVSVRQNQSGDIGDGGPGLRGNSYTVTNVPAAFVIKDAFNRFQSAQIVGLPKWATTDRFDITGRRTAGASLESFLQGVLTERFRLTVHQEMRQLNVFAFTRATTGKTGSGLRPRDCTDPGAFNLPCGRGIAAVDAGIVRLGGVAMARLSAILSDVLGQPVIDETKLEGVFDLDLQWRPDIGLNVDLTEQAKERINTRPALPGAVQEQLGLKLQARRAVVDVLVIDHIERPTPD